MLRRACMLCWDVGGLPLNGWTEIWYDTLSFASEICLKPWFKKTKKPEKNLKETLNKLLTNAKQTRNKP